MEPKILLRRMPSRRDKKKRGRKTEKAGSQKREEVNDD
jgi:hypothetical protein